jgi:hypothetical protein
MGKTTMIRTSILFLSALFLFSPQVFAQDKSFTHKPASCDFQIAFPEKPFIEQKCVRKNNQSDCHDVVSYTKAAGVESSLNIRFSCRTLGAQEKEQLSDTALNAALEDMVASNNLETTGVQLQQQDGYRSASVIGFGKKGNQDVIYNAQMWVGSTSLMTLEADMTGKQNEKIEKEFSTILKSVTPQIEEPRAQSSAP